MPSYFFPLLFVAPEPEMAVAARPPFRLSRRKWSTSTFDLATLATKHRLHLPYQLMDVFLAHCHVELEIEACDIVEARELLGAMLLGFYLAGRSPMLVPFATTHSINAYSGINSRDSVALRKDLPAELQEGLTSDTATVEAWPVHLSLECKVDPRAVGLSETAFQQAAAKAIRWLELESAQPLLRVVREAAQSAPMLSSTDQALLHLWCALEALFPRVGAEVSFRLSLYLAELSGPADARQAYFERARKAYTLRSKVAHGSERQVDNTAWLDAWGLLIDAGNAVVERGRLPTEDELLQGLLASHGLHT